ncbi:hypothetical protein HanXRQr2_Chr11g0472291 [Helianthus annuus]|uniref:Uncharacterized protein n=1 Tax=Helianthus annuus TaxID=4232 RepID=A0A9K3HL93_HELAN|nr:hypothetical protein HanXRQr2_Chr11g0472291 [Helianthus annuus]KAJ0873703.1 hypothetical protein HanPSC8_Chr11g0455541 [Helianthus annuus]
MSPNHLSFQKLVLFPFPKLHRNIISKLDPLTRLFSSRFTIAFHVLGSAFLTGRNDHLPRPPWILHTTLLQSPSRLVLNLQAHLTSSTKLTSDNFVIPNPPYLFGLETTSQETQYIPLPSLLPNQRNFRINLSISSITSFGALNREK